MRSRLLELEDENYFTHRESTSDRIISINLLLTVTRQLRNISPSALIYSALTP